MAEAKYEPEEDLSGGIWLAIKVREKRTARRKLWLLSGLGLASFVAAVPAIGATLKTMSGSGFYEYLSLAFSNGQTVLSHFNEFSMSLLESMPVVSMAFSLSLLFIFFLSARQAGKHIEGAALSF